MLKEAGVLVVVGAAWAMQLQQMPIVQALQVLSLVPVTLLLVFLTMSSSASTVVVTNGPAVQVAAAVRKPYPKYDLSAPKESFAAICPMLIEESCAEIEQMYEVQPSEVDWIRKMLKYNVEGGKMNRGLTVVDSGAILFKSVGKTVGNDELCKFAVLGWCIEWLQGWLLVADDFMDSSLTRRGRPCWYQVKGVEHIAINDAFLIEMLMFKTMRRHFGHLPEYSQLLDLMMETTFQTELGQLLDLRCEHVGLKDFTVDRWTLIVKYKTAFYSFYIPVAMSMILAGITDRAEYDAAREILVIMGIYFQAQDDYLDAFGTAAQIGKIGTDIQDKKCGWLFVHAYHEVVTAKQKTYFDTHYGNCKCGSKEELEIKKMYNSMNLTELYKEYEANSYAKIMALRHTVKQVPWAVFETFLNKIYKRKK